MSIVSVAKRAGVSIATVSRVINDLDNVRGETADQVRAAMRELGYTPPKVKRGPKGGRRRPMTQVLPSGQIAVLTLGSVQNWLTMPVMASVVGGITREAKDLNVWAVLDEMPDPGQLTPIFRRREVDGAVVFCNPAGSNLSDLMELHQQVPVVWVMGGEDALVNVDHVSPDNSGVGRLAFDYLQRSGCEHFAFITDEPNWPIMRLRGQSFGNAARDARKFVSNFLLNTANVQPEAFGGDVCVRDTMDDLIGEMARRLPRKTGLFVPTDLLLTRLHPLLVQHRIWGDENPRIVSCDNENERLSQLNPRPASIDIQGEELGRLAVRQLVQRLQRPEAPPARVQLAPRLVPGSERQRHLSDAATSAFSSEGYSLYHRRKHSGARLIEFLERRFLFNQPGANWALTFDDEFNGTSLDTTKWANYLPWNSGATGDNRFEGGSYSDYMVNADTTIGGVSLSSNLSVSDGALHLKTQQTSSFTVGSQTFNYTGAMLTTGRSPFRTFSSGYFEIRAKLPTGPKNWPAFWMTNGWPPEDDIMEYWPTHNSATAARMHQGLYGMDNAWHDYNDNPASINTSNYHTWGMEWGPGYQKFYVDNQLRLTDNTTGVPGGANPEYLLLNSEVDATRPGTYTNGSTNTLDVDYVRVYTYTATPGPAIANPGIDVSGGYTLTGKAAYNIGGGLGRTGTGDFHIYDGPGEADQTITGLSPNTSYTFNAYGEVGTGTTAGIIGVKNYSSGAGDTSKPIGDTANIVWVPGSVSFTTGPSDTSAVIYLKYTGTGRLNFDDLYLEKTPVITTVVDQFIPKNGTGNITINTANSTSLQGLVFSASSDNPTLLPAGSMVFTGNGTSRTLQITPAANVTGSANVMVTLTDQFGSISTDTFVVSTAVIINGDRQSANQNDSIRLVRNGSFLDVYVNNTSTTPTEEYDYATTSAMGINGLGGNDTITIDASGGNPVPAGGLIVDLGTNTLGDTFAIIGSSGDDSLTLGNGSVQLNGSTINVLNAEGTSVDLGTGSDTLGTSGAVTGYLALTLNGDTLSLAPGCTLPSSTDVNVVSGILNIAQASQTIDALAGGANSALQVGGASLSVGNASGGATFSGAISGSGSITKNGSGSWTLGGSGTFAGAMSASSGFVVIVNPDALGTGSTLSIGGAARVNLQAGMISAVQLAGLNVPAGAIFDINDNDLAIDYTAGNSPFANLQTLLGSGYTGGTWNGQGIRSTSAGATNGLMEPAAMESSALFSSFPATFANRSIDNTAVLIHYAVAGDAALNGVVNALDFNALASNFGAITASWTAGDFNYDGAVTSADFTILATNFNASVPSSALPGAAALPSLFSGEAIRSGDSILNDAQPTIVQQT